MMGTSIESPVRLSVIVMLSATARIYPGSERRYRVLQRAVVVAPARQPLSFGVDGVQCRCDHAARVGRIDHRVDGPSLGAAPRIEELVLIGALGSSARFGIRSPVQDLDRALRAHHCHLGA